MKNFKIYLKYTIYVVAQRVKRLPTLWETRVWTLGQEEPLEKEMATHFSTFAWKIPWTEKPGSLQSMGSQRVRHHWATLLTYLNIKKRTQLHPSTENWIKDLLSITPPIRTRPSIPLSLSPQEAFTSLLSFSIRGQTDWKPQSQKTSHSDHMDHSLN